MFGSEEDGIDPKSINGSYLYELMGDKFHEPQ